MLTSHWLNLSVVKSIAVAGVETVGVIPINSSFPSLSVIISSTGANTSVPKSILTFMSSSQSISSSSLFDVSVADVISNRQTSGNKVSSSTISTSSIFKSSIKLFDISNSSDEPISGE